MMDMTLQADQPDDFVLATGGMHSVRQLVEFAKVGRRIQWRGASVVKSGLDAVSDKTIFWIDPNSSRPPAINLPVGDTGKPRAKPGRKPKRSSARLIEQLMPTDSSQAKQDADDGNRSV